MGALSLLCKIQQTTATIIFHLQANQITKQNRKYLNELPPKQITTLNESPPQPTKTPIQNHQTDIKHQTSIVQLIHTIHQQINTKYQLNN
jgi:hypothetical protein